MNIHRIHFENDNEHSKINRYIEITSQYINLFINNDMNILDVGASDGEFRKYLKGKYKGIDIDPASTYVEKGDIYSIPKDNKYDMIIYNHTLEHMKNTHSILDETYKKINDKGYLFINIPIGDWSYNLEGHIVMFNEEILTRILKETGFEPIEISKHCFRSNCIELWVMSRKV